ncbi:MAG: DUF4314 domain-containing protein [Dethiobacter sp.]|jgi:hypothetical protein|nr:DUF4314 domain-containing protein [Dethiobacter sp.]MBS3901128.1 DUF4314 domain-containing protein [Dethiobacter sp.]
MNKFPSKETVERLREEYPQGTRVELVRMNDPFSKLKPGVNGIVDFIDDAGSIFCIWDSGSTLGVVYGEDVVKKLSAEKGGNSL